MHAQGLGNAGTEAICLNQCTNKRTDVVNAGAIDQIAQGIGTRLAGAHLEIYQVEFIAQIGMGVVQILAHAHKGLVEGEAGFNANDGKVQGVGQGKPDALLAVFNHALQDEAWKEEPEAGKANEEKKIGIVEAGE